MKKRKKVNDKTENLKVEKRKLEDCDSFELKYIENALLKPSIRMRFICSDIIPEEMKIQFLLSLIPEEGSNQYAEMIIPREPINFE